MVSTELVVLVAATVAVAVRTGIPFLQKMADDEKNGKKGRDFQHKFTFSALLALALSVVTGIMIFPTLLASVPAGASQLLVFATIFGIAYTGNDLFNRIISPASGVLGINKDTTHNNGVPQPTK